MSATLKNKDRQPLVLMLDHPAFATKAYGWKRTTAKFGLALADGGRSVREVRRSYAGTLTLMPGESVSGLHEAIEHCSQVPLLRKRGLLELTIQAGEPDAEADADTDEEDAS